MKLKHTWKLNMSCRVSAVMEGLEEEGGEQNQELKEWSALTQCCSEGEERRRKCSNKGGGHTSEELYKVKEIQEGMKDVRQVGAGMKEGSRWRSYTKTTFCEMVLFSCYSANQNAVKVTDLVTEGCLTLFSYAPLFKKVGPCVLNRENNILSSVNVCERRFLLPLIECQLQTDGWGVNRHNMVLVYSHPVTGSKKALRWTGW